MPANADRPALAASGGAPPDRMLTRGQALAVLREHQPELAARFGVTSLALFGSVARGESTPDSDVDVLVGFDGPATAQRYFGVWHYLEDLLGRPIDLVTDKTLRPEIRPNVEAEVSTTAPRSLPRRWDFYLRDMLAACEKVAAYTHGLDQAAVAADERTYDAVLRNLEVIGEAATHVPDAVRSAHADIPWRAVIGARNRIIHGYLDIDDDAVWTIVREYVPNLARQLRAVLDEASGQT